MLSQVVKGLNGIKIGSVSNDENGFNNNTSQEDGSEIRPLFVRHIPTNIAKVIFSFFLSFSHSFYFHLILFFRCY